MARIIYLKSTFNVAQSLIVYVCVRFCHPYTSSSSCHFHVMWDTYTKAGKVCAPSTPVPSIRKSHPSASTGVLRNRSGISATNHLRVPVILSQYINDDSGNTVHFHHESVATFRSIWYANSATNTGSSL